MKMKKLVSAALIFAALLSVGCDGQKKYEYMAIRYVNGGKDRIGEGSGKYESVSLNISELNLYGDDGWEIVGCYLEMETAFPNFGSSNYVTGIQPNVRPQSVVVILKREKRNNSEEANGK